MNEQEFYGLKFIKMIQDLVITKGKEHEKQLKSEYVESFSGVLDVYKLKIDSLRNIILHVPHLNQKMIEVDQRGAKLKRVTLEFSTQFFSEIISHIALIVEQQFMENEQIFIRASSLLIDLIFGFQKIGLETIKGKLAEDFYSDLINAMVPLG